MSEYDERKPYYNPQEGMDAYIKNYIASNQAEKNQAAETNVKTAQSNYGNDDRFMPPVPDFSVKAPAADIPGKTPLTEPREDMAMPVSAAFNAPKKPSQKSGHFVPPMPEGKNRSEIMSARDMLQNMHGVNPKAPNHPAHNPPFMKNPHKPMRESMNPHGMDFMHGILDAKKGPVHILQNILYPDSPKHKPPKLSPREAHAVYEIISSMTQLKGLLSALRAVNNQRGSYSIFTKLILTKEENIETLEKIFTAQTGSAPIMKTHNNWRIQNFCRAVKTAVLEQTAIIDKLYNLIKVTNDDATDRMLDKIMQSEIFSLNELNKFC